MPRPSSGSDEVRGIGDKAQPESNPGTRTIRSVPMYIYLAFQPNKRRPPRGSYSGPPRLPLHSPAASVDLGPLPW